jgi:hypothetical protein
MKLIKKFRQWIEYKNLSEAIVDEVSDNLSDIFTPDGKMKPEVRKNIDKGIEIIKKEFPDLKILDYFVIGAAVTYQYKPSSDIDTTVVIDKSTSEDFAKKIDKWIEYNLDKTMYHTERGTVNVSPGAQSEGRPYQFKINKVGREDLSKADSAYDSIKDVWIKKPSIQQSKEAYRKKISDKDSIENKTYSQMEKWVQPSLQKLLDAMNNSLPEDQIKSLIIKAFTNYEIGIKRIRKKAYSSDTEQGMVSKNWGKGNVVYKMFDKEGYTVCYEIMKDMKKSENYSDANKLAKLKEALQKVVNDELGFEPARMS